MKMCVHAQRRAASSRTVSRICKLSPKGGLIHRKPLFPKLARAAELWGKEQMGWGLSSRASEGFLGMFALQV